MPGTPQEIVEEFRSTLPPRLSSTVLAEYGLALSSPSIQRTTQVLLSLSLFWMEEAFHVTLPKDLAPHILDGVYQWVVGAWVTEYGLDRQQEREFSIQMSQEHPRWREILKEGGEPIAVLSESVSSLELDGMIGSEDRQKTLALFLDLVPIEEVGEIAGRIEEEFAG